MQTLVASAFDTMSPRRHPHRQHVYRARAVPVRVYDGARLVRITARGVGILFGTKATVVYKVIFTLMILSGALMTSSLAWDISDTFNGLMMIPNLIGVVALCPLVVRITRNYVDRKIKKKTDERPLLNANSEIQAAEEVRLKEQDL